MTDVDLGNLGSSLGLGVIRGDVPKAGDIAAVGRAFHDDRKSAGHRLAVACGAVYVRGKVDPVAHPDADVAFQMEVECRGAHGSSVHAPIHKKSTEKR